MVSETLAAHIEKQISQIADSKSAAHADVMRGRGFGDHEIAVAVQQCRDHWIGHLSERFIRRRDDA